MEAFVRRVYSDYSELAPFWPSLKPGLGKIVFTNGCFDILHSGHVAYLEEARSLGDALVLGLNGDDSVRRLKGPERPLNLFEDRASVVAGLRAVDLVVGFAEDTPLNLIHLIQPDVLVKGGDWEISRIVGASFVMEQGGEVRSLAFKQGRSTTGVVERILERYTSSR
jgi:D-beta-D-heptose 7-phosphate kinase/D-beta-D-heptose 1-phosphate adenosyltransferase